MPQQVQRIEKAWQLVNGQAVPISLGSTDDAPNIPFGTCTTNPAEQVKLVNDLDSFSLEDNARVVVKFTKTNTASSPQLNVMSSGAHPILYKNAALDPSVLTAGRVYEFLFDEVASAYQLLGGVDTNDEVTQSEIPSTSGAVPLLLAGSAAPAGSNAGTRYSATFTANPSTGTISATAFSGTASHATADASGNNIESTYATKSEVSTGYLPVNGTATKATADASGNTITSTYATKSELSGYVTTSGTAAKATADASGNDIETTYATKAELDDYLPADGTAVKATADASGNTITSTYATKAELSGYVGTADTAYAAVRDGAGNNIALTYATKQEISGMSQISYVFLGEGDDLPENGVNYTVYFKPIDDDLDNNAFEEYFWINNKYERLGVRSIDLSQYATKSELNGYVTTTGTAAKATADASGNDIETTYATKAQLSGYVTTTGTAAKATADASGNTITSTYATKSEVSTGYLPVDGTAVKATADASGNTITSTYATKDELDGYVTTNGTAAKATADASGNTITTTYATKSELSGYVTTSGTAAKATADASGNDIETTYATKDELDGYLTTDGTAAKATQLESMRYIDGIGFNGTADTSHYYTCSTASATATKAVTGVTNFKLYNGAKICLKFTNANTANNPMLNVNSTGAKYIYYNGTYVSASLLVAGGVYEFVYDGSYWQLLGGVLGSSSSSGSSNEYYLKTVTYGSNSMPSRYTMQDGTYVDFTWDSLDRLSTVYESDTGYLQTLNYDSYGRLASITRTTV